MFKKLAYSLFAFLYLTTIAHSAIKPVIELPYEEDQKVVQRPGWEERTPEFTKWLAPSVMVTGWPNGGGGSGTICYYDPQEKWIYIISCGHLYSNGYRNVDYYKRNPHYKKVTVFYHNNEKLDQPKTYKAETLCSVWDGYYDVSLLRFKADWVPQWVVEIAPVDFELEKDKSYHSCGCDGLRPVAHYMVKYIGVRVHDRGSFGQIIECLTIENGPRGGRSGGGVMTDDLKLLMICSRGDNRYAYWTSLQQIHKFLNAEGFKFILEGSLVRDIPIIDRNNPQGKYPRDYIPLPKAYKE